MTNFLHWRKMTWALGLWSVVIATWLVAGSTNSIIVVALWLTACLPSASCGSRHSRPSGPVVGSRASSSGPAAATGGS